MHNTVKMLGAVFAITLGIAAAPQPANATLLFDISWTGSGGYSMTGMFGYDESLINTGAIDETQISGMMIEVFLNNASQGTWDLSIDGIFATFNFNFDTTTETFLVGGKSDSLTGQEWNFNPSGSTCPAPGVGFGSGSGAQLLCVNNGGPVGLIVIASSTLSASRKVPEPSTLALFAIGLAGLGFVTRRRRTGVGVTEPAS